MYTQNQLIREHKVIDRASFAAN